MGEYRGIERAVQGETTISEVVGVLVRQGRTAEPDLRIYRHKVLHPTGRQARVDAICDRGHTSEIIDVAGTHQS